MISREALRQRIAAHVADGNTVDDPDGLVTSIMEDHPGQFESETAPEKFRRSDYLVFKRMNPYWWH